MSERERESEISKITNRDTQRHTTYIYILRCRHMHVMTSRINRLSDRHAKIKSQQTERDSARWLTYF